MNNATQYLIEYNTIYWTKKRLEPYFRNRWTIKYIKQIASEKRIFMEEVVQKKKWNKGYTGMCDELFTHFQQWVKWVNNRSFIRDEIVYKDMLDEVFFDLLKFETQYKVWKYKIDFYCVELNLAIEYDEKYHILQTKKDLQREERIAKILWCDFLRVTRWFEYNSINSIIKKYLLNASLTRLKELL